MRVGGGRWEGLQRPLYREREAVPAGRTAHCHYSVVLLSQLRGREEGGKQTLSAAVAGDTPEDRPACPAAV